MACDCSSSLLTPACKRLFQLSQNSNAAFAEKANYASSKNFELKAAHRLDTADIEAEREHSSIVAIVIRGDNLFATSFESFDENSSSFNVAILCGY